MADWVTADEVIQELADRLHQDVGEVATRYVRWAESTVERAVGELRGVLLGKGWLAADIDRWDLRHPYSLDLAALYCGEKAKSMLGGTQDSEPLKRTDPLERLKDGTFVLTVNGVVVLPAPLGGGALSGTLTIRQDFDAALAEESRGGRNYWDRVRRGEL